MHVHTRTHHTHTHTRSSRWHLSYSANGQNQRETRGGGSGGGGALRNKSDEETTTNRHPRRGSYRKKHKKRIAHAAFPAQPLIKPSRLLVKLRNYSRDMIPEAHGTVCTLFWLTSEIKNGNIRSGPGGRNNPPEEVASHKTLATRALIHMCVLSTVAGLCTPQSTASTSMCSCSPCLPKRGPPEISTVNQRPFIGADGKVRGFEGGR